jgi:hypothetical protein
VAPEAPSPRKRKPVISKRTGATTVKQAPVLQTSVQQPAATSDARGGAVQRRDTVVLSGVAIGAATVCVAQLNVTVRPVKPWTVPRVGPFRSARA